MSDPEHMRVVVHDYCGHPFQVQLSRALARRGHDVLHLYCPSVSAAHGDLTAGSDDPPTFAVGEVALDSDFEKYSFRKRLGQEHEYGGRLVRRLAEWGPDVVISANTPLLAQRRAVRWSRSAGVRFVFWQQDALGIGIQRVLRQRFGAAGSTAGKAFVSLEDRLLKASDAVVVITDDFRPPLRAAGVPDDRVTVVENWAPLEEISPDERRNAWSAVHGLDAVPVVLYAGTLGLKHNPELLLRLAGRLRDDGSPARVVVVSEGMGADWLREHAAAEGLDNIRLLGFQPWEDLPSVFATADLLVAVLEPDAGVFSVPSKVLSYLCAERALLLAVPAENLAARLVDRIGAGAVVDPLDVQGFVDAGARLLADPAGREASGRRARAYAEATFDIERITDRFEPVLAGTSGLPVES